VYSINTVVTRGKLLTELVKNLIMENIRNLSSFRSFMDTQ
jgi:hypothetical protein